MADFKMDDGPSGFEVWLAVAAGFSVVILVEFLDIAGI